MTEEMSGGLRHHSDEASGPELCGWIQQSSKQDRYRLEPTSASALRASYATKLLKQSSIYLDIADVVRDVEKLFFTKLPKTKLHQDALLAIFSDSKTFCIPQFWVLWRENGVFQQPRLFSPFIIGRSCADHGGRSKEQQDNEGYCRADRQISRAR